MATLALVQDVTDNAALLTLLSRAALGGRPARPGAARTAGARARRSRRAAAGVRRPAGRAAVGRRRLRPGRDRRARATPWTIPATSTTPREARERFGLLVGELRRLRSAVGEPILDLVRRIIDITGIDVELASSVSPAAAARRDNLDLFVQAVAEFQAVDGSVTLDRAAGLARGGGRVRPGPRRRHPSEADSVKLLTVHRAKGLEWDAVFLVGVTEQRFPSNRGRSAVGTTAPCVMPVRAARGRRRPAAARGLPARAT